MAVKRISPDAARSRMLADDATLICAYDSREECLKYRIEGAISLAEFQERLPSFPDTREFIFYCALKEQKNSTGAAEKYAAEGYHAMVLDGGYDGWKEAGCPMG